MSLLDQCFVYHPEPWQDRDWAGLSGLPLEEVWFQAADGARLFGWYAEAQGDQTVRLYLQLSQLRAESGKAIRGKLRPRVRSIAHFD